MVVGFFIWTVGGLISVAHTFERAHPESGVGGEVGFDLVTLVHNFPVSAKLVALVAFAAGFGLGLRYFSRSLRPR